MIPIGFSWCHDCVDLHIEIAYPFLRSMPRFVRVHNKKVLNLIRKKFKPLLGWIKYLESLVIIPRGNDRQYYPSEYHLDPFILELLDWMFLELEMLPSSLKRLWIREESISIARSSICIEHLNTTPHVMALNLWTGDVVHSELDHPKLSQMEHLGGIHFSNNLAQMALLKFVLGFCVDDHVIM